MLRVLIAEDESLTRIGLRYCLDNDNSEYELVGEAENGQQALEMCQKYNPHILITDIKMPVMDGLTLIRRIRQLNLDIKIVVLTCYEDFSYLYEAMHLGIDDYLLKTALKPNLIINVLDTIRLKYWGKELPAEKNSGESRLEALESILMGYIDESDEISRLIRVHNLSINFDRYALMLIEVRNDSSARLFHHNSTLQRGIHAMLVDCIQIDSVGEVSQCDTGKYIAFLCLDPQLEEEAAARSLHDLAERIILSARQALNMDLFIGVSELCSDASQLSNAFDNAQLALDHALFGNEEKICLFPDLEKYSSDYSRELFRIEMKNIHDAVFNEDGAALKDSFERIYEQIGSAKLRSYEARSWLIRAYMSAISALEDKTASDVDFEQKIQSLKTLARGSASISQIREDNNDLLEEIIQRFDQSSNPQNTLIQQVIEYTDKNYMENLTLEHISRKFGINVTYFCKLFKAVVGLTYVEYLTVRRINEAKNLLRNDSLPSYQIASMVGYQNPEYFSKTFKRITGKSPKEYKRTLH